MLPPSDVWDGIGMGGGGLWEYRGGEGGIGDYLGPLSAWRGVWNRLHRPGEMQRRAGDVVESLI